MKISFSIVDVFTDKKFSGNQLAVFQCFSPLSDDQMQNIAREMHFSETTFINPVPIKKNQYSVRIFTPEHEVPFAGHPVLGSAYVIREELMNPPGNEIILELPAGLIPVSYSPELGRPPILWMKQPSPVFGATFHPELIAHVLQIPNSSIDTRFPVEEVSTGLPFIIVPLLNREAVISARIHDGAYQDLIASIDAKALHIFCNEPYNPEHTFHARMFGPYYGVPEDPATGSANGCLAAYIVKNRYFDNIPPVMSIEQGYAIHRPSQIYCKSQETENNINVEVGGSVILVARGEMIV
jgi:trans-2,3-dihydro-3-hydroxyanthranilate isomerase